jgi:hypothetical protein
MVKNRLRETLWKTLINAQYQLSIGHRALRFGSSEHHTRPVQGRRVTFERRLAMPYDMTPGACLVRPRLLIAAARSGAALYRRERDLAGLLGGAGGRSVVAKLAEAEAAADADRRAQAPAYSAARHVRLLSALLAETAAARATAPAAA